MRNVTSVIILVGALALALIGCSREHRSVAPAPATAQSAETSTAAETSTGEETSTLAELTPVGEQCGGVICRPGLHCCNPTCNACVPKGVECTQQTCN